MVDDERPKELTLDHKWDAVIDLTLRRFVYSTAGGAVVALTLFRSPTTRWSAVAFGAGLGLGSAIRDSSYIFNGSNPKWPFNFKAMSCDNESACSFTADPGSQPVGGFSWSVKL